MDGIERPPKNSNPLTHGSILRAAAREQAMVGPSTVSNVRTTEPIARVLVRVWLPDRPGALGQVAARIGAVRGDIAGVDVLERDGGVVIDEFAVDLPDTELVPMLVREIEEVDGASVEEVRLVKHFPDPRLDALESAAGFCDAHSDVELFQTLVDHVNSEFMADWSALASHDTLLAANGRAPAIDKLHAFALGTRASPLLAEGLTGPDDLAVAALPVHDAHLLVGRDGHPFRRRERRQLLALSRIADRLWTLLEGRSHLTTEDDDGR